MRPWPALIGAAGLLAGFASFKDDRPWTLVVSGDTDGYLSPCGCTAPMTGGIRRRATAIRQIGAKTQEVLIDTGGLGGEPGRQSELKAETMAQSLAALDAAAIHLTARDLALGPGTVDSIVRLAEGRVVGTDVNLPGVAPYVVRGPFVIGGVSARAPESAIKDLEDAATGKSAVLMIEGDHAAAVAIARNHPGLAAVVYRRAGWPEDRIERVGSVALLTPGEHGKAIVRTTLSGGRLDDYRVSRLDPTFSDDPTVSRYYRMYLKRVTDANLLDAVPRTPSRAYVGEASCVSCHASAHSVWKSSGHAHALLTLERDGHGRDPDCVSCHVTGFPKVTGFVSRAKTPQLSFVSCESCHGPGGPHAKSPRAFPLPKVGAKACVTCHTPEQSPRFDFATYWRRIAHK